jgi:cell division protein FtsB
MLFLFTFFIFFILLPSFYFIFRLYNAFIISKNQILLLTQEIHLLQEKQNIIISEIQKLNVQVNAIESASAACLTNSNLFYGLLGLSALILLGLFIYSSTSGDTVGLVVDLAKLQIKAVGDCTKILLDGIEHLDNRISNVNTLDLTPMSEQLFKIQVQIYNLDSKIDSLARSAGLGDFSTEFLKTAHENASSFLG